MPPKVTPQVPGEPKPDTEQAVPIAGDSAIDASAAEDQSETVAVPKAQLDALMSRLEALEKTAPQPSQKVANPEALLPDQNTIDPAKIKIPVLSKQGWVVPAEFGTPPVAKK